MANRRVVIENPEDTESVEQAIRDVLEASDEELVAVEVEPISREQHEANQALVEYMRKRR